MEGVGPSCRPGAREEQAAAERGEGRWARWSLMAALQLAHCVPYIRHGNKGGGPDWAALCVGNSEVVAGRAVGVHAQLQTHLHADEASRWMELLPLIDAAGRVTHDGRRKAMS